MDRSDAPQILRDFLIYHETIRGHSKATVDEYYLDLRTFFRFLKLSRGLVPRTTELDEISIADVDVPFVASVTLAEVYDFLAYLARDRDRRNKRNTVCPHPPVRARYRQFAAFSNT